MKELRSDHGDLRLAVAQNRNKHLSACNNSKPRWQRIIDRLGKPRRDQMTVDDFNKVKKEKQSEIKGSAGWFSACHYENAKRNSPNAGPRSAITLDVDELTPQLYENICEGNVPAAQHEFFAHSTRSHSSEKPRLRIVIPCVPAIPPDKFNAVSRIVASMFGHEIQSIMDATDPVSFRVAQLMFFPTVSSDQEFVQFLNKGEVLDYRDVLAEFNGDWQDASQLPTSTKRMKQHQASHGTKKQDPRKKGGLIGLFCRTWNIEEAIAEWLTEVYEPGTHNGADVRYTYIEGSTSNGAVVYDDGQHLWSTHATDPVFDEVHNGFDLVRIHKFRHLDKNCHENTKLSNLPSYHAMVEMLMNIPSFLEAYQEMRLELDGSNPDMFDDVVVEERKLNLDDESLDMIGSHEPISIKRKKKLPKQIIEMNTKHAVAMWNGDAMIVNENTHGGIATFSSLSDLNLLYRNKTVTLDSGSTMKLANYWLEHPYRRTYERGVAFIPGETPKGVYNLFQGWPVQPEDNDAFIDRILWHITYVLCKGNKKYADVLIKWMAHRFQRPTERIGFAVVLRGRKGTGKDTLGIIMKRLLGRYYVPINKPEHLTGQFNAHMAQALFVHVEEGFFAGHKRDQGVLQSLITNETVLVERKGVDSTPMSNFTTILITSNEDWVIPASDDERRWYALDVSEKKIQNREYFDALYEEINSPASQARLMHYLMNEVDLSDFDIRKPPVTPALMLQKVESLHNVDKWIYARLIEGSLGGFDRDFERDSADESPSWDNNPLILSKEAIYEDYKTWHREQRFQGEVATMDKVLKTLQKTFKYQIKRASRTVSRTRARAIVMPSLPNCRKLFEARMGNIIVWPDTLADDDTDLVG